MHKIADRADLIRQIVFIDRTVEDYQTLGLGINANTETIALDLDRDGVAQIGEILAHRTDISAIHIVSHGSAGCLQLGKAQLNSDNLQTYGSTLQQWGNRLTPDAEILLYGCEVAAGETGAAFVEKLSHLTKAKIAASAKRIGSAEKGGHWKLEYTTGEVRSPLAFQPEVMAAYKHVLASFSKPTNFGGVSRPQYVAMSDFNGDSILDLAVPNRGVNNISIFIGDGKGSFNSASQFATGQYPFWVTVGNFNADSFPDLAVANWGSSNVSVLLGNGTGSFSPASNFAVGTSPWSVASGDFNNDSYLDLATANIDANNVSILLGNGAGSFAAANNFSVGSTPQSVAVGDFNKDNYLDVVTANFSSNNVSVLLGNGAGSFGAAANFAVGSNPYAVVTGDLNQDGIFDIATANESSSNVSVLFGNGAGGFSAASNFAVGAGPRSVAISDLNVDGIPDLLTANGVGSDSGTNNISILLGNGTGGFAAATHLNLGTGPWTVAAGDLNADGMPDLATSNYWTHQISVLMNMGVKFGAATYSTAEATGDAVFNIPVILSGTPLANVTVPIAINLSSTATAEDYALSANSLTFAAGATGAALTQNIAVTVKADSLPEGDKTVVLDFGAIAGAVPAAIAQTTLTIAANDTVDFAIAAGTPSIPEGNSGPQTLTFTVTRSGGTDVASSVDYSIGGTATESSDYSNIGGTSGATGTTGTIDFAAGETSKTITLDVLGDALSEGNEEIAVTLSNPVAPGPVATISTATAISAIANDDIPGITVNPTSELTTTEAGGTATFTVILNSQPTADVTLALSNSNSAEATLSTNSLTFTAANWNQAQTVTVTGVDDAVKDGNLAYSIVTAAAVSSDTNYSGIDAADVAVTNTDNDTVGIIVNPTSELTTTEAGVTATFTVVLNSQPTADVTLALSNSNSAEATLSTNSLTFTAANWNQAQTVTVTGVDDAVKDGDLAYSIVTAAAVSADTNYSGIDAADVAVTNTDNDTAGITITPTSGLTTTETEGTATFTVVLNSQPTADVTLALSSSNLAEGTLSTNSLTFTAANWNQAQTVTVTGVDDAVKDGNIAYSIVTAAAVSSDTNYSGIDAADVALTNSDSDTPGITVNPTLGLTTTEAEGTATFTVVLNTQPTADVTLALSSSNSAEGTLSTNSVTFTAANWNQPQTVTVTGVDDAVKDGDLTYSIVTAAAVSADTNYSGMDAADVAVTNTDNDNPGIVVNPTSELTTTEAGGTATFTVILNTQPTADVTLALSSSNSAEGTLSTNSLTFTAANWNQPQTVTVKGVDDAVKDGTIAYNIVTAAAASADTNYSGIEAADVALTNTDNDIASITVTPTSRLTTTEAGGTATFTVILNSQPTADVTLGLSSSNSAEGTLSANSLTFTAANWNQPQTVTVKGVNDVVDDDNIAYNIVTAAGVSADTNYSGIDAADVAVTNTDNDTASIRITPPSGLITGLITTENGGTATFTVALNSQPTADVTLNLSSSNEAEGTVSTKVLTFNPTNWNQPQTVKVTGVADSLMDGEVNYTVGAAATSTDPKYNLKQASVDLTNSSTLPTLNFSQAIYTVNESRAIPVQAQVTLTRAGDLTYSSYVQINSTGGNAISGRDYWGFSNNIIFNANEASKTLTIDIRPDTEIEGTETVNFEIASLIGYIIGNQNTATLQIVDGTIPTINFSQATYTVNESRSRTVQAQITLTRAGDLSVPSSVQINRTGGNAISGTDYSLRFSRTVTFNANEASKTLTVDIWGDSQLEGTEAINFEITSLNNGAIIGSQKTATLQIIDAEPPLVEFSQTLYQVSESRTAPVETQITLKRTGNLSKSSSVQIDSIGGTAYWMDFDIPNPTVTFNPNEDTKTLNVSIYPDNQNEGTEDVQLAIANLSNASIDPSKTATLQILDNPPATVEFSQPTYSVKESLTGRVQAEITLKRTGDLSSFSDVELTRPEGSATYGTDYQLPHYLFFEPNEISKTFIVDILPDTTVEGTEEINLGISRVKEFNEETGRVSDGSIGAQKTATLQIIDAEPPKVEFSQEIYLVKENSTAGILKEITLKRTGDLSQSSSVQLRPLGWHPTYGSDTATYGQDYGLPPYFSPIVNFAPGEDTKNFTFEILPDAEVEEIERLTLGLVNGSNAIVDPNKLASVQILDSTTSTGNRPPVVTNPIRNQGIGLFHSDFKLTLAADTFTDPDPGDSLTYSATMVQVTRLDREPWLSVVGEGSALPSGITFDPSTRTFTATTGNPINIFIEVKATDIAGESATDFFQLWSDGINGICIDGYIAGATVFFDANKNGVQDANEPSTTTDNFGSYALDIPFDVFDTDKSGEIEPTEGQIVGFGGIDTATDLPLETPLVAPPYATVLTLLTSLVADLIDRGVEADEAEELVKISLSLPTVADVTGTDPIAAANNSEPGGVELLAAMTKLQNFITQTAGLIDGASTATKNAIVETVVAAITSQIQAGVILDFSNPDSLAAIIQLAVAKTKQLDPNLNAILTTQFIAEAAEVMAASNQAVDSVVANTASESLHPEIAKVQKVTLDEVVKDLKEAAAGTKLIEDVIAEDTGTALEAQIRGISIDTLTGGSGTDTPTGGSGTDTPTGGSGIPFFPVIAGSIDLVNPSENQTFGTEGDDNLIGSSGDDAISAKQGKDTLIGGDGNDLLFGNSEDDFIDGNAGNDTLYGGKNNDTLLGSGGKDRLLGNLGNDNLSGGDGDDYLNGNQDNDTLDGGDGNDTIHGGKNADILKGNGGEDVLFGDMGDDNLDGGDGDDYLNGNTGKDVLDGAGGNDTLHGGKQSDSLSGSEGGDRLCGDLGDDSLNGGTGGDRLFGNKGKDLLNGDEGDDFLYGGQENDTLIGGEGSDFLSGDKGSDLLTGGAGSDRFVLALGTGGDTITDFTDGEDSIALAGGLTFGQLTISSGDSGLLIRAGDELLASLTGVQAMAIAQQSFIVI